METIINKYIDENRKTIIELETLLSGIPAISPLSGGEGEYKKADALKKWLQKKGFRDLAYINAPDSSVPSKIRPNLILTLPGKKDEKTFWIMSHMDVVPPGDLSLWETDPYKVTEKEGRLYGRGTEDNQHGITASVMAALALKAAGALPEYTVKLLFVADEEMGSSYGIKYIIENHPSLFSKNDYVLIPDSGSPEGDLIEIAEKNMLWLKFETKGEQCHASRPDLGKNAFTAASSLVLKLAAMEEEFKSCSNSLFDPPYSTFAPTKKEANIPNINTIPGEDIFYLDCRILPELGQETVLERIDEICREVENRCSVKITKTIEQNCVSAATKEECEIIAKLKNAIKEVSGKEAKLIGIGGGTVAAYLRNRGIDAAVWSTIEETAHMPNEYTIIDNLKNDAKIMAHMMLH